MNKFVVSILVFCSASLFAQNLTTVTASNIQKGGAPLSSGTLCFTATDANDNPIGFRVGGGGQEVLAPYCTAIANGAIGVFNVANPANTSPANIEYRVEVFDAYSRVLKYSGVQFSGATFNFDNYIPSANLPLGTSVNTLSVGSLTVTSGCTGCGVGGGGSGYATIENAASAITQRSVLNWTADITCLDNSGPARSDCSLAALGTPGSYTKVTTDAKGRVSAGTSAHTTDLADFNPAAPTSNGKVPIWDQASQTYIPGDPLVQGIVADGSTTAANPVAIGGYDTAGTPVLHRAIELNAAPGGTEYGLVTRNIPSGTQNVSITNAGVPVTGTFWQATQPISGAVTASQSNGANLHVDCDSGCGGSPEFTDNSAFTAGTTVESNMGGVFNDGLTAVTSGNGAAARITPNRALHVNLRNNSGTEIGTNSNPVRVDPTGTTTQPISGTVTANAGTGTFNIQSNASVNLAQYNGAGVGVANPQFVTTTPSATGGWSKVKYTAETTTVQTVKSSQGTFGGYFVFNPNTSDVCVQVFDNSGTIMLGTTVPDMVFHLPGVSSGGSGVAANLEIANGVQMANAIKLAVATTCTGSTAPASGLDITIFYK